MLFVTLVMVVVLKIKTAFKHVILVVVSGQVRKVQNTFLGQMQTVTTCPTCNGEGTSVTAKCTAIVKEKEECMEKKPLASIFLQVYKVACN
jgi:excinuclease UvrABC ATPase subunit